MSLFSRLRVRLASLLTRGLPSEVNDLQNELEASIFMAEKLTQAYQASIMLLDTDRRRILAEANAVVSAIAIQHGGELILDLALLDIYNEGKTQLNVEGLEPDEKGQFQKSRYYVTEIQQNDCCEKKCDGGCKAEASER